MGGRDRGKMTDDPERCSAQPPACVPYCEELSSSLGEILGFDRFLFGSDLPHPERLKEPMVDRLSTLTTEQVRLATHANAARLLGLKTLVAS